MSECKLKPAAGKMIVKRDKGPEKTPGGIMLPDSAKDKKGVPFWGRVVVVGLGEEVVAVSPTPQSHYVAYKEWPPLLRKTVEVKVGDRVAFSSFAGYEVEDSAGEKWLVMNQEEVLCIDQGAA